MSKFLELLTSRRFWLITVGALSAIGGAWAGEILTAEFVFNTITVWVSAIVGIGSLDKWADKLAGK